MPQPTTRKAIAVKERDGSKRLRGMSRKWSGSSMYTECTLHQISPYIGKVKSTIASSLVTEFSNPGQTVYDPFCGSGTVALEAWIHGRNVIANDLSPYAHLLTQAKLFPARSEDSVQRKLITIREMVQDLPVLRKGRIDEGVAGFFHPKTLDEVTKYVAHLKENKEHFLLAALMGILHHQRPGFLSYPSSHTVPYLRTKLFPKKEHPELYRYREVHDRLSRKITRTLKRVPDLNRGLSRLCYAKDASKLIPAREVDLILTSPPYMRQLDYGRDNRLRLWFLGEPDWIGWDKRLTPNEGEFLQMMRKSFALWRELLPRGGHCIMIVGDSWCNAYDTDLPKALMTIAQKEVGGFKCTGSYADRIPGIRRVRRSYTGNSSETILVLKKVG